MIRKVAVKGKTPKSGVVLFQTDITNEHNIQQKYYRLQDDAIGNMLPLLSVVVTLEDGTDHEITSIAGITDPAVFQKTILDELYALGYECSWKYIFDKAMQAWWEENSPAAIYANQLWFLSELVFKSAWKSTEEDTVQIPFKVGEVYSDEWVS